MNIILISYDYNYNYTIDHNNNCYSKVVSNHWNKG